MVDDAIVVVENVERIMEEEHLGAYEATKKAMTGLAGALIATSLVLDSRVRASKLPAGHHGTTLPPVHRNDCGIGTDFHRSGPDAKSGHVLAHPENRPTRTNLKTSFSAKSTNGCPSETTNTSKESKSLDTS